MSGIIGLINVSAATVGASEVKSLLGTIGNTTTRATLITPTSGKKVRLISVVIPNDDDITDDYEVYFGTGANITTTAANAIFQSSIRRGDVTAVFNTGRSIVWPDGAGPVGAVDAVVTGRRSVASGNTQNLIFQYREE